MGVVEFLRWLTSMFTDEQCRTQSFMAHGEPTLYGKNIVAHCHVTDSKGFTYLVSVTLLSEPDRDDDSSESRPIL